MASKKNPIELLNNPMIKGPVQQAEPPVTGVMEKLTTLEGPQLEIMSNIMNPQVVDAVQLGYTFVFLYDNQFVKGLLEQLLRCTVGRDGRGRTDVIEGLRAGANVPDTYYEMSGRRRDLEWEDGEQ